METNNRIRVVPESHETVVFRPNSWVEGQVPSYTKDLWNPAYRPYFECYTPNSKGSKTAWKPFQHYKSVQAESNLLGSLTLMTEDGGYQPHHYVGESHNPFRGYWYEFWSSYGVPYGDAGCLDDGLPAFYDPQPDGSFVAPAPDEDSLKKRALRSMLPLVRAELSLPNFIYELKDFKRPVNQIVKQLKQLYITSKSLKLPRTLLLEARTSVRKLRQMTASDYARKAASNYLNLSFNILPLISDTQKLYSALSRSRKRISDLINRAGGTQTKHFRYVWSEFVDENSEKPVGGFWNWQNQDQTMQATHASRQVFYDPTIFHAQLRYNYNYTEGQVANAQLYGHLDALGVNFNPAIIWNAIPFSFVVDWVLGVGQYLDSLKMENMKPTINIHSFLWSVTRRRRIVVRKGFHSSDYRHLPRQTNTCPMVTQTAYRRDVGTPDSSSIELSGLSLKEFSLGASLVVSSTKRRR